MEWVRTEFDVRFVECDPMNVVHHSNYIRWFEMGRYDYAKSVGMGLSEQTEFYLPVIDVHCTYKNSALFGDTGFSAIHRFDLSDYKSVEAAMIPEIKYKKMINPSLLRKMDTISKQAAVPVKMALDNAKIKVTKNCELI